jgi:addiction module HigA family antidote
VCDSINIEIPTHWTRRKPSGGLFYLWVPNPIEPADKVNMKMHNPPHPGEVLSELCLKPLGLSVTQAAHALGVSRKTLSSIVNGRAGMSPEMAIRLSKAFDTTTESWLNQQVQYDLWHAEPNYRKLRIPRLSAA